MLAILTSLILLSPGLGEPILFEADTLTLTPGRLSADKPKLVLSEVFRVRAAAARFGNEATCRGASVRLTSIHIELARDAKVSSAAGSSCLRDQVLTLQQVTFQNQWGRGSASDAQLALSSRRLSLRSGSFTGCDCEAPPWRVDYTQAEVDDDGVTVHWPVFTVGDTSLLTVPRLYVPLGDRRSGFLLPRVGFRDGSGLLVEQPFYWAIHRSVDATVFAGTEWGGVHRLGAEVRWASLTNPLSTLYVESNGDAVYGSALATLNAGNLRLLLTGEASSPASLRGEFVRDWRALSIETTLATGEVSLSGRSGYLSVAATTAQSPSMWPRPDATRWSESWWRWRPVPGYESMRLTGDLRHTHDTAERESLVIRQALDFEPSIWLGPVLLNNDTHVGVLLSEQRSDLGKLGFIHITGSAEIAWSKRAGRAEHRIFLRGDAAVVSSKGRVPRTAQPVPLRNISAAGVALGSRWRHLRSTYSVQLRQGVRREHASGRLEPVAITVSATDGDLSAQWYSAANQVHWGALSMRSASQSTFGVTFGHSQERLSQITQAVLLDRLYGGDYREDNAAQQAISPTARFRIGPLLVNWSSAFDLLRNRFAGQSGELTWVGDCQCWSITLAGQHRFGQFQPDFLAQLDLGAP